MNSTQGIYKSVALRGIALVIVSGITALGQSATLLYVNGSRPLAQAAQALEHELGVSISYEDSFYEFSGDLIDKTDPKYKQTHPDARVLIPRGGLLSIPL